MSSTLRIMTKGRPLTTLRSTTSAIIRNTQMEPQKRMRSAHHGAVHKLRGVLDNYRQEHYSRCLPSRFKKEVICALDKDQSGVITMDDVDRLLVNIGAAGHVTREELEIALGDAGVHRSRSGLPMQQIEIPVDRMLKFL